MVSRSVPKLSRVLVKWTLGFLVAFALINLFRSATSAWRESKSPQVAVIGTTTELAQAHPSIKNLEESSGNSRTPITGRALEVLVVNEGEQPVHGASVYENDRLVGTTRDDGRLFIWEAAGQSRAANAKIKITIEHPKYEPWRTDVDPTVVEIVAKVSRSIGIDVSVHDEAGNPIENALAELYTWEGPLVEGKALGAERSDSEGGVRFRSLGTRSVSLTVSASGFVRANRELTLSVARAQPYEVVLAKCRVLRVRVFDDMGSIVPRASVVAEISEPESTRFISRERGTAGPDGVQEIHGIPITDTMVGLTITGPGIADSYKYLSFPAGEADISLRIEAVQSTRILVTVVDDVGNEVEGEVVVDAELFSGPDRLGLGTAAQGVEFFAAPHLRDRRSIARPGQPAHLDRIPIGVAVRVAAVISGGRAAAARNLVFDSGEEHQLTLSVGRLIEATIVVAGVSEGEKLGRWQLRAAETEAERAARLEGGMSAEPVYCCNGIIDDRGVCRLLVKPGEYRFRAWLASERCVVDAPLRLMHSQEIKLEANAVRHIAGRLIDQNGRPLEGWTIVAPSGAGTVSTQVGTEGGYKLAVNNENLISLWARSRHGMLPVFLGKHDLSDGRERADLVKVREIHMAIVDFESTSKTNGILYFGYSHPLIETLGTSIGPSSVELDESGADLILPVECIMSSEGALAVWAEAGPDRKSGVARLGGGVATDHLDLVVTRARIVDFDRGASTRGPWIMRWNAQMRGMNVMGVDTVPAGEGSVAAKVFLPRGSVELEIMLSSATQETQTLTTTIGDRFVLP